MLCLGIESTAHTFGIGIIDEHGNILADKRDMFRPKPGKGFIPRELADHHLEYANKILADVLQESKIKLFDIDVISFSQGPGIPNALRIGSTFARFLSAKFKKPLVGVNHCIAHIEIGKMETKSKDPVIVYLSGGNTQIIAYVDGAYRIFGESEDIPVGNCFDVVAREMNLQMPGGPEIEKLAKSGKYVELPYVVKGMDLSFTGIATDVEEKLRTGVKKEDVAYSLQETCFAMLTEVTERALAHTGKKEVLLVGGVAANKRLQEMMNKMCESRGAKFYVVSQKYSGDNGSMIAWVGILAAKNKQFLKINQSGIRQNWRTDQVEISWI